MSARVCSVEGCTKLAHRRGWCPMHYQRWRRNGDPLVAGPEGRPRTQAATCSVEGCENPTHARGLCHTHYAAWRRASR